LKLFLLVVEMLIFGDRNETISFFMSHDIIESIGGIHHDKRRTCAYI